jgi:hypothetical protein
MSRLFRPLLVVALVACSLSARAASLRLLEPAPGRTLRGGSTAELQWSAAGLPPEAEEWEAFLSVDGGEYYSFRVTPHLDIELQRFTFTVPNIDARDARFLLRVGNEVRETSFEVRGSFSIVRDERAPAAVPPQPRFGRGEAAREGDRPVLFWTEGAREGDGLTQQSAPPATPAPALHPAVKVRVEEIAELAPEAGRIAAPPAVETPRTPTPSYGREREPLPPVADLLLACRRRNI